MPEGDTIYRAAVTLHRALAGHIVQRFESVFPALTRLHDDRPLTGRTVQRVSSRGKHVLIEFSGGDILRTHMRMNGSWHIYRPGEKWQRPRRDMRIVIGTERFEAVAFSVPVAEFIAPGAASRNRELRRLGPDLLGEEFDASEAARRLRARSGTSIAQALLNQSVLAGIGNVYKSEVLFSCGVNPFAPVARVEDAQIDCLLRTARRLLLANVTGRLAPMTTYSGMRKTTSRDDPAARLWVYGRAGEPCRKCGTPIRLRKQGLEARLTYWCPKCQPEPAAEISK
jgi:endonuclease-8